MTIDRVDKSVYKAFPKTLLLLTSKWLAKDKSGLLGRNRKWGQLYSPRFQLGAGKALRISLAAGAWRRARRAYLALKVGTEAIDHTGYIRTKLPITVSWGRSLKNGDIASAASFYLGDACLGISALETMTSRDKVAQEHDIKQIRIALRRGTGWLLSQREVLMNYDQHAPNRLFFDALAYQACGHLLKYPQALDAASEFIHAAERLQTPDGYFLEKGGWDTSYQAVSIDVGKDILLAGFPSRKLENTLYVATRWLAGRVDNLGRINSSGNTRTCGGGESFLGRPKKVAIDEVFIALAYLGIMKHDHRLLDSARHISRWYQGHTHSDPCFSF